MADEVKILFLCTGIAVQVMNEAGVDITTQRSKRANELLDVQFGYVVTMCDHANEHCPVFPGRAQHVHVGFDDPPGLAKTVRSKEEAISHYRRVRDDIRAFAETPPGALNQ